MCLLGPAGHVLSCINLFSDSSTILYFISVIIQLLSVWFKISITMPPRKWVNLLDSFCFICGEFMVKKQQLNITDFVKKVYLVYFKLKLGDQDKVWAPHKVCKRCVEDLRNWSKIKAF